MFLSDPVGKQWDCPFVLFWDETRSLPVNISVFTFYMTSLFRCAGSNPWEDEPALNGQVTPN